MKSLFRSLLFALPAVGLMAPVQAYAQTKVLFESMHAQTVGNADWVLDEDSCGTAQRYPTPAQSGITSTTPETYWGGAFSSFGVALVKKGFSVESLPTGSRLTYGDTTNAQDLQNYKVFIIPEPNIRFTTAERTAIQNFVKGGGGLFLISDHWNSDRNNDTWDSPEIMNDLMVGVSWGVHFQVSPEADNWFDDAPDSKFTTDTSSPIVFTGPYGKPTVGKGLGLFGSTSLTLNPTANPNAKGHVWMNTGTVGATTRVTFATSTDGTGRIASIGDSSPAEDATNGCGHTTYNGLERDAVRQRAHPPQRRGLAGGRGRRHLGHHRPHRSHQPERQRGLEQPNQPVVDGLHRQRGRGQLQRVPQHRQRHLRRRGEHRGTSHSDTGRRRAPRTTTA